MTRHQNQTAAVLGLFGLLVFGESLRADVPLVEDGRPVAIVATADSADEHEKLAARELLDHVEQMSGAKLELSEIGADDGAKFVQQARRQKVTPVLIGRVAQPRLRQALEKKGGGRGTFALQAADGAIYVAGVDEGPAYGVAELLEQQGVRWFMPGPLGTVVPAKKSVAVAEQLTVQSPSFPSRWFQMPNYKGLAWYRQTLAVPAEFQGRRMFLWCGGADEKAKVWLNGRELGVSHGAAFYPFEMDATQAVRPGEKNVLVMAVMNGVVNEIGTGGLVAPVMLYAPAKGRDAQLENTRPLGETFP